MTIAAQPQTSTRVQVARQGTLLFSGYAAAQVLSFARNALIGHWLSKGDFGIAASITMMLQLLEAISDLGADRLIVQAPDGDDPRLLSTAHATMLVRGIVMSVLLYVAAKPVSTFFGIKEAEWAFEAAALVPLVKAFMHLDSRRYQRRLQNGAQILLETAPQALALVATVPVLLIEPGYAAVLWLALLQAAAALVLSHTLAERRYAISVERAYLERLITFGWPIWLSAFPLIAVYQGDRFIIGAMLGMEDLAAYSTAFLVTMVPGLVAAKVGQALLLPLLSAARNDKPSFVRRFSLASEATALAAAIYLAVFIISGGAVLPLAFGPNYTGLGAIVSWLALMWSLRMMQAVPGIALMALGQTRPFLVAGLIRAAALPLALVAANEGLGLAGVATAGVAGELASLLYVAVRVGRCLPGLASAFVARSLFLVPAVALSLLAANAFAPENALVGHISLMLATVAAIMLAAAAVFRDLRALVDGMRVETMRAMRAAD